MEIICLRDQFAMAALQGEIASQNFETGDYWTLDDALNRAQVAERCYLLADAMLSARDKNSGRLKAIKSAAKNMVNNPQVSALKSGELILGIIKSYGE